MSPENEPYIITTDRLHLREWLESDIEPFSKMSQDDAVMKYFPKKMTTSDTIKFIEKVKLDFKKNSFGLFAVEHKLTKEFLGYTGFAIPNFNSFFTPCIEIGWRYKKEAWGHGFATESATACLAYGFTLLQFERIVSFTATVNEKSKSVMNRIGMKHIADFEHPRIEKEHILCKHVLYQITRSEFDKL